MVALVSAVMPGGYLVCARVLEVAASIVGNL